MAKLEKDKSMQLSNSAKDTTDSSPSEILTFPQVLNMIKKTSMSIQSSLMPSIMEFLKSEIRIYTEIELKKCIHKEMTVYGLTKKVPLQLQFWSHIMTYCWNPVKVWIWIRSKCLRKQIIMYFLTSQWTIIQFWTWNLCLRNDLNLYPLNFKYLFYMPLV